MRVFRPLSVGAETSPPRAAVPRALPDETPQLDAVAVRTVGHRVTIGRYAEGKVDEQRQSQNLRTITGIKFG